MFDRVSDISDSLTGGSGDGEADLSQLPDMLGDDEEPAHILANSGSIEHTKDGRTTTVEPSGDEQAYVLVTDERILYVLGDQPDSVEIAIDMEDFKASHVRKGLLNSKLHVKSRDESVLFAPDEGDIEATQEYIDSVASCWADMNTALAKAGRAVREFEEVCEEGNATGDRYIDAKSNLSEARSCATRVPEVPSAKMRARIDDVEAELSQRRVEAWTDRAANRLDAIAPALAEDRYGDACDAYAEAADALDNARNALEGADADHEDVATELDHLETDLRSIGEEFLAESNAECENALSADEPAVAIDAWEDAFDRYSAAVEAGWNGHAPVPADAIEYQLTWVTSSLLDALGSHATMLEQQGDDCEDDDDAQEYYGDAEDWFQRAEEFAAEHPERSPDEFADATARVEDKKLERSGWEFGA